MIELEKLIIGSCFGEDQYRRVKFLEPDDFNNYPSQPYREYFKILKKVDADDMVLSECIVKTRDKRLRSLLVMEIHSLGCNYPERKALLLLEMRFKRLLSSLLYNLSSTTKKTAERELLNEAILVLANEDTNVFDLSDHLLEYLGVHASDYTKSRINSFLSYRDKRANYAKQIINELR